jgi:hypothetical protein
MEKLLNSSLIHPIAEELNGKKELRYKTAFYFFCYYQYGRLHPFKTY